MGLKSKTNLKRRDFTKEFKLKVLAELDGGMGMAQISRKYGINTTPSVAGENNFVNIKTKPLPAAARPYTDEARIAELERMVGRLTMENDLLKKALQRLNNKD